MVTKKVQVYVRLVDEGTDVWRPATATKIGDVYMLDGPVPDGERWEFQPGAPVHCKLRRFTVDPEDRLVAYELAPSASGPCCFCGVPLPLSAGVELAVYSAPDRSEVQALWCHQRCLSERLHPSVPQHPDLKV